MLNRKSLFALFPGTGAALLLVSPVLAHGGEDTAAFYSPGLREVLIWTAVLFTGWLYVRRTRLVWRQLGEGRGIPAWRLWLFLAALLTYAAALASPLEQWSGQLFSAHMVQHILLIFIASPLLVLGLSPAAAAWLAPARWRRPLARTLHKFSGLTDSGQVWPLFVWILYALALWIWHLPVLYEAALSSEFVHILEHVSFVCTAVLFWWTLAYSTGSHRIGLGLFFIFTSALHNGLLGVLLTFSRAGWYPAYAVPSSGWNIGQLSDQQLGGAIMWVAAGFIYVMAVVVLLHAWFKLAERREKWAV